MYVEGNFLFVRCLYSQVVDTQSAQWIFVNEGRFRKAWRCFVLKNKKCIFTAPAKSYIKRIKTPGTTHLAMQ